MTTIKNKAIFTLVSTVLVTGALWWLIQVKWDLGIHWVFFGVFVPTLASKLFTQLNGDSAKFAEEDAAWEAEHKSAQDKEPPNTASSL